MSYSNSLSIIPESDSNDFRTEVAHFNLHGEYKVGSYYIFIYDGRFPIESLTYEDSRNLRFLNDGIKTGAHLHVSVESYGTLNIRGNLDLGKIVNLKLEESRGFSVPTSALDTLKSNAQVLSIINAIIDSCKSSQGNSIAEFFDDDQRAFYFDEVESYYGIFSEKYEIGNDSASEAYSMIIYSLTPDNSFINDMLSQLAELLENLDLEFFVEAQSSYGDYRQVNSIIGTARIDASFGETWLYIVDDEICIE